MDSPARVVSVDCPRAGNPLPPGIEQRLILWNILILPKLAPFTVKYSWHLPPPNPRHDDPHLNAEAFTLVGGAKLVHKLRTSTAPFDTVKLNNNYTVTITCRFGERADRLPNRRMLCNPLP